MAVTKTNNLRKGSKGSDVVDLQEKLNANGYKLDVDGSFGAKTLAAVKDYQKNNGLAVDGIVGTKTWGALTGDMSNNTTANKPADNAANVNKTPTQNPYASTQNGFGISDAAYNEAISALLQGAVPISTSYDQAAVDAYNAILGKEPFSYDLNEDALYQQYADQYRALGKTAMQDAMGQAAAMTSGYGNSYAASAGNQAYQAYLQQLNDVVPELYGMAQDQYNQEVQSLYDRYSLASDMASDEYGRKQDAINYKLTLDEIAREQENTEYERGIAEAQLADSKKQEAYDNLVGLITTAGYVPTAKEMAAAGLTQAQVDSIKNYHSESKAAAGVTEAQRNKAQREIDKIFNSEDYETEDEKMEAFEEWVDEAYDDGLPEWFITDMMVNSGYMDWLDEKKRPSLGKKTQTTTVVKNAQSKSKPSNYKSSSATTSAIG